MIYIVLGRIGPNLGEIVTVWPQQGWWWLRWFFVCVIGPNKPPGIRCCTFVDGLRCWSLSLTLSMWCFIQSRMLSTWWLLTGLLEGPALGTAGHGDDLVLVEVFGEVFSFLAWGCLEDDAPNVFWVALHFRVLEEDGCVTAGWLLTVECVRLKNWLWFEWPWAKGMGLDEVPDPEAKFEWEEL